MRRAPIAESATHCGGLQPPGSGEDGVWEIWRRARAGAETAAYGHSDDRGDGNSDEGNGAPVARGGTDGSCGERDDFGVAGGDGGGR